MDEKRGAIRPLRPDHLPLYEQEGARVAHGAECAAFIVFTCLGGVGLLVLAILIVKGLL